MMPLLTGATLPGTVGALLRSTSYLILLGQRRLSGRRDKIECCD
jgi:hypothetical protein